MFTRYILPAVALFGVIFAVLFVHAGNKPVPASQAATAADMQNQWKNAATMGDARAMSAEEIDRRHFAAEVAAAKLVQAKADVGSAEAQVKATEIELDRRIVRARVDGSIMQCKIH